jgi:hypothetical protein
MHSVAGTVPGAKPLISLTTADLPTARLLEIQQCAAGPCSKLHIARAARFSTPAPFSAAQLSPFPATVRSHAGTRTGCGKREYKSEDRPV